MAHFLKWLAGGVGVILIAFVGIYTYDKLLLSPKCPPCHSDRTRDLPMLGPDTQDGLVQIPANGMTFRARVVGVHNTGGEAVILLHGYPETSLMWRPLLDALAKSGYRAVAFDQRGYSPGARPGSIRSYQVSKLVSDVMAIADKMGFDRFHLVGHDWGGVVGWMAADRHRERVISWTSLSMPHPLALSEALTGGDQLYRHRYVVLTWLPGLYDFFLRFNRAAYYRKNSWRSAGPEQRKEYEAVFSEPGAVTAALNWYRAYRVPTASDIGNIRVPTLYVWGHRDGSFGRIGVDKTADYVDAPYQLTKVPAGHFLMSEAPQTVSDAVLRHIREWPATRRPPPPRELPLPPHIREKRCPPSKPHCLFLEVAPDGRWVKIENRCERRYAGTVRLACSSWASDAPAEYFFDLMPGSVTLHRAENHKFGSCYYDQLVCLPE